MRDGAALNVTHITPTSDGVRDFATALARLRWSAKDPYSHSIVAGTCKYLKARAFLAGRTKFTVSLNKRHNISLGVDSWR